MNFKKLCLITDKLKSFWVLLFTVFLLLPFHTISQPPVGETLDGPGIIPSDADANVDEKKSKFDDSLERFMRETAGPHQSKHRVFFEPTKPASEAFKKECGTIYPDFKNSVEEYIASNVQLDNSYIEIEKLRAYNQNEVEKHIKQCAGTLNDNYRLLWRDKEKSGRYWNKMVSHLNQGIPKGAPESLMELIKHIKKWEDDFYTKCINLVDLQTHGHGKNISLYRNRSDHEVPNYDIQTREELDDFGETLAKIHERKCHEKRKEFEKFFHSDTWQALLNLPDECREPAGCVSNLRKLAGLEEDLADNEISLFQACTEKHANTNNCCFASYDQCEQFQKNTSVFQKLLKSSKEEDICSSRQVVQAKNKMEGTALNICEEASKQCGSFCAEGMQKDGLAHFQNNFLKCFYLPILNEKAYALHEGSPCRKQITEIQKKFNENLRDVYWNKNKSLTMETFYQRHVRESLEESCGENLKALKRNKDNVFHASMDRIYAGECKKLMAEREEEDSGGEQRSAAGQTVPATTATGRGGSGSNSGSARSYNRGLNFSGSEAGSHSVGSLGGALDDGSGDNLNPEYFPNQGKGAEDSSRFESSFNSKNDEYKGPGDPFAQADSRRASSVINPQGVGSLSKLADSELNRDKGETSSSERTRTVQRRVSRSISSFSSEGYSSRSGSSSRRGFRGLASRARRGIKKAARRGYIALFGDPRRTVKNVFNVHGPEVDLMERQRELARQFCKTHECNF